MGQLYEQEIARLQRYAAAAADIFKSLDARSALIDEMKDFEKRASDPSRLFQSSFRLNYEEKFRKNALPDLLRIEHRLFDLLDKFQKSKLVLGWCSWSQGLTRQFVFSL